MKSLSLIIFLAFPLIGATAPSTTTELRGQEQPLERILEAREVRFRRPVVFWREGKKEPSSRAVLLRVRVRDPFLFLPRGLEPPEFVYGGSVCRVLRSPLFSGEGVLLAPPLRAGEPATLWLAPVGLSAREVSNDVVRRHRPSADDVARGRGLHVRQTQPPKERIYEDADELRKEFLPPLRK